MLIDQRLKIACKLPFWLQKANRPSAFANGRLGGLKAIRGDTP
jgi:hypothetical protein